MQLNVLITAGSRRVPLVEAFRRALRSAGVRGEIITTDVNPLSPAMHVADRAVIVPLSKDPAYVDALEDVCRRERVGLLVPTIDDELPIIARAKSRLECAGARVVISPAATADICNDKYETAVRLRDAGVSAAESWLPGSVSIGELAARLPLFIKPRGGRGSIGAFPARTRRELEFFLSYVHDPVVQQFLDGPEFTIDLLCDRDGQPLSIVPRERVVIRAGVTDRGRTVKDPDLVELGRRCAEVLDFRGPINVQCRVVAGRPTVFEVNPRFSGGIPLTIAAGADFPRMLVDEALDRSVTPRIGEFIDGLWMTSYESSIFLPGVAVPQAHAWSAVASEVA